MATNFSNSFTDFPEDVQLSILSFLTPPEIATFSCTSKRFLSLCRNDSKLWFSMCHRRWASKTQIHKWAQTGKISYKHLYRSLAQLDNLLGFWRRCGPSKNSTSTPPPPLVFFEWGPFFVTGSKISPSKDGSYDVIKDPFLWVSVCGDVGEPVCFMNLECRPELTDNLVRNSGVFRWFEENELVPVNLNFMGKTHVVIEENTSFLYSNVVMSSGNVRGGDEYGGVVSGSPPEEIYQYFANRTSPPGGNGAWRRQKRREKERRKWEPEHFVKIQNSSPTPDRPLQGLWKGICTDLSLEFYLVMYDDIGGVSCRTIGDPFKPFSGYAPVFWTSNTTFIESPLSPEEEHIYDSRLHIRPPPAADDICGHPPSLDNESVSRILYIDSSYDLVIAGLVGRTPNPRQLEGRIWQYANGTFGFGFLRDNLIIDLKHIALNGSF